MKLNDTQRDELIDARERGYLVRYKTSRKSHLAWDHYCDAAQSPLIELVCNYGFAAAATTYDLIFTGAQANDDELQSLADLIDNLAPHRRGGYVLGPVIGRTSFFDFDDAVVIADATATILNAVVERCRA
jgi:hypothetical protein